MGIFDPRHSTQPKPQRDPSCLGKGSTIVAMGLQTQYSDFWKGPSESKSHMRGSWPECRVIWTLPSAYKREVRQVFANARRRINSKKPTLKGLGKNEILLEDLVQGYHGRSGRMKCPVAEDVSGLFQHSLRQLHDAKECSENMEGVEKTRMDVLGSAARAFVTINPLCAADISSQQFIHGQKMVLPTNPDWLLHLHKSTSDIQRLLTTVVKSDGRSSEAERSDFHALKRKLADQTSLYRRVIQSKTTNADVTNMPLARLMDCGSDVPCTVQKVWNLIGEIEDELGAVSEAADRATRMDSLEAGGSEPI